MNMKISVLLGALAVVTGQAIAQKTVESKITEVTVYLNRAQVTRQVRGQVEAGQTQWLVSGLPAKIDPNSIQVSGRGQFVLLGTTHRQNFLNELNMPRAVKQLADSIAVYQHQAAWEGVQKELLAKEEQMLLSNQKVGGGEENLTAAELKAMADFFRLRLTELAANRVKADERLKKVNSRIAVLQRQLQLQNELFSRNSSEVVITLQAEAQGLAELLVSYVVADAGWFPAYDLRTAGTTTPMTLNYKANVFQTTGEEWPNVKLRLSTANPSLGGVKPELAPWYLRFAEAPFNAGAAMRSNVARMESAKMMDAPASEAQSPAQFTSVMQTALHVQFEIGLPYTVASSNRPTVVDVAQHTLPAQYRYAVAPKLDADAFLMARIIGWEELALLPGEAGVFLENTFVGNTFIDPAVTGDTLSVSLGRDKRIVVKRSRQKELSSRSVLGPNRREEHAWQIAVRNTRPEPVTLLVEDQIPVSQNTLITVGGVVAAGAKRDMETGALTWELTLQANEERTVSYRYELRYPKDKKLMPN
jgi:uncharacterized protein (TIGR02231 family)